jgi:hypothetical protein
VAPHDSMLNSSAPFLRYGEPVQAVIGAQAARAGWAALTGVMLPGFSRHRIIVATPGRILVLDAGRSGLRKARGVVAELPRSTRLGPVTGLWHQIPVGPEILRVHRRFFADVDTADATMTDAIRPGATVAAATTMTDATIAAA